MKPRTRQHPDDDVTYVGRVWFRTDRRRFGIRRADRRSHFYVIGRTGTGKSTLLKNLCLQDIANGEGGLLLDPHGDLADAVREEAQQLDRNIRFLDATAPDTFGFNPFAGVLPDQRPLAVAGIVEVFAKIWSDDWGPRLEHLLRNVVATLLEIPGATFRDIPLLLTDRDFRRDSVAGLENKEVAAFWRTEYERYSPAFRAVVAAPLQNKVGAILADPRLVAVLCRSENTLDWRRAMDTSEFVVVSLAKGILGEGPAALLGSLLVSHLAVAGLGRADVKEENRRDFYVYVDEFHTFATLSVATMLAELRKYRVNLILAHQYLGQLEGEVRDAVFGNVGSFIAFRVGALDAHLVARELGERFGDRDLVSLPNYAMYLRLLIHGEPSGPFSAQTMPVMPRTRSRRPPPTPVAI